MIYFEKTLKKIHSVLFLAFMLLAVELQHALQGVAFSIAA